MEQRQEHVMSLFELYSCKLVFISILQDEAVRHLLTCPKAKFILIKPYFLFVLVRAAVSGRHLGKFRVRFCKPISLGFTFKFAKFVDLPVAGVAT